MNDALVAGLELGGTKCVAILARGQEILALETVPTTTPAETLAVLDQYLQAWWTEQPFAALGIASFGPLGLDPDRADYGHITTTPKPGWACVSIVRRYRARFPVPVGFDTDVNGAALAEYHWGAGRNCDSLVYLTIGTGLGGGVLVRGEPVHGLIHPEIGHVRLRRSAGDDFRGICPFHGDCLEGLISGPALATRAGIPAQELGDGHPVWGHVVHSLAELVAMLVLTVSPQRIVIGGGVGNGIAGRLPAVRSAAADLLNGYVGGIDSAALSEIVRAPDLGDRAGPLGAIALGLAARGSATRGC